MTRAAENTRRRPPERVDLLLRETIEPPGWVLAVTAEPDPTRPPGHTTFVSEILADDGHAIARHADPDLTRSIRGAIEQIVPGHPAYSGWLAAVKAPINEPNASLSAFRVGDEVEIIHGEHKGMYGRVEHVRSGPHEDKVSVALDHPVQRAMGPAIIDPKNLRHPLGLPEETFESGAAEPHSWKPGDLGPNMRRGFGGPRAGRTTYAEWIYKVNELFEARGLRFDDYPVAWFRQLYAGEYTPENVLEEALAPPETA